MLLVFMEPGLVFFLDIHVILSPASLTPAHVNQKYEGGWGWPKML